MDALFAKHVFVAGEICDVADDQAMELAPVNERGADITGLSVVNIVVWLKSRRPASRAADVSP